MRRGLAVAWVAAATFVSGGCPHGETLIERLRPAERFGFDMGSRGGGYVAFRANAGLSSEQSGDCREPVCHTTIEDLTNLELTPIANGGFQFRLWEPDTARGFPCDVRRQDADGTIAITVVHDGACYAVFAPIDPNAPTTPGVR